MTSRDFCYWLQGFFEIQSANMPDAKITLSPEQVAMVERHLALVFKHEIDPSYGPNQAELNQIHAGKPPAKPSKPALPFGQSEDGQVYRC